MKIQKQGISGLWFLTVTLFEACVFHRATVLHGKQVDGCISLTSQVFLLFSVVEITVGKSLLLDSIKPLGSEQDMYSM